MWDERIARTVLEEADRAYRQRQDIGITDDILRRTIFYLRCALDTLDYNKKNGVEREEEDNGKN